MTLVRKASRLPSIARDGWRYPALRVRARGEDTAVEALAALGFDEAELRTYEREFDEIATAIRGRSALTLR